MSCDEDPQPTRGPERADGQIDDCDPESESSADWLAEATIVGRAQDRDVASFETLMRRYQGLVFGLARRMLTDRGDAEDVVQDVFLQVWRRLPSLIDPSMFRAWLYQIATRRCLNVIRTRASRFPAPPRYAPDADQHISAVGYAPPSGDGDPAATANHRAQLTDLERVLHTLPDEQRVCWVLRELNGLSYAEISYATQLPISTVRGRIARARQNLMEGMAAWR